MNTWYLCVPGPSYDPSSVPDNTGPVICVNAAINGATRCDYWSAWDAPNPVHDTGFLDFRRLQPEQVTDRARAKAWAKWYDSHKIPRDEWPSIHTPTYGPLWFKLAAKSPLYTFFASMSFAIQQGATHIHIIGCDLAGQVYHDERVSRLARVRKRPKRVWDSRWTRERQMLANVIHAGRSNNVSFSGVDVATLPPPK